MDTTLIAKVLPTKQAQHGGNRTIGTGYPIGKGLVLTARHVVIFPERDVSKPITVEWPDLNHKDDNAELVFDGGAACDIAILKCRIPPQAHVSPLLLSQRPPQAHEEWASFGYPTIGKGEDGMGGREKTAAMGEFFPPDDASHKISLSSVGDAVEKSGWKGISGAPVFQQNILYAVITSTPKNREECFTAVSIPYLLANDQKFRDVVGIDRVEVNFDAAIVYLKEHDGAKAALFAQITLCGNAVPDSPKDIVRYLVKLPIADLIRTIHGAQKQSKIECRRELGILVRLLLPSLYGFDCVSHIRSGKGNAGAGIIEVPYATDVSAEILMAGVDQRPADFRIYEYEHGKQIRPGKYRLGLPPEAGADDGRQQQQYIEDDLYNRLYGGTDISVVNIAIDEHLFNINPRKQQRSYKPNAKKNVVKAWLEDNATEKRPSFYWLFNLSGDEVEDERLRSLARELKANYPHITLLSLFLDEEGEREIQENRIFNLLADTNIDA